MIVEVRKASDPDYYAEFVVETAEDLFSLIEEFGNEIILESMGEVLIYDYYVE